MQPPERHLRGPLQTIEWTSGDEPAKRLVVVLHGYGAPGDDLAALAPSLADSVSTRFVFPAAPLSPPDMAGWGGLAWWPLRLSEMLAQLQTGSFDELFDTPPPGVEDARAALSDCLDAVRAETPDVPLVLGGFSQGAMLSADVGLRSRGDVAGLMLFSGAPIDSAGWGELAVPQAFVSHGTVDEVLPFACGEALRDRLRAAGSPGVQFVPFEAGHTIPSNVVAAARTWIASLG